VSQLEAQQLLRVQAVDVVAVPRQARPIWLAPAPGDGWCLAVLPGMMQLLGHLGRWHPAAQQLSLLSAWRQARWHATTCQPSPALVLQFSISGRPLHSPCRRRSLPAPVLQDQQLLRPLVGGQEAVGRDLLQGAGALWNASLRLA
jgi:hypothetical protein